VVALKPSLEIYDLLHLRIVVACHEMPAAVHYYRFLTIAFIVIRHHMANRLYRNMTNVRKRQSQNASRRRSTLTNKAYEYAELYGADVALIIYQKGRYYTYVSGNPCFPPSKKEIVGSLLTLMTFY
jgi:hypothetical protein